MSILLTVVDLFFNALILAIIARALLSWFPIDPYSASPLTPIINVLRRVTDPILDPIQRYVPPIGGTLDISPIIALIILQILQALIHNFIIGILY